MFGVEISPSGYEESGELHPSSAGVVVTAVCVTDFEGSKEAPSGGINAVISQDGRCEVWYPGHVERSSVAGVRVSKARWYQASLWFVSVGVERARSFGELFAESVGSSVCL